MYRFYKKPGVKLGKQPTQKARNQLIFKRDYEFTTTLTLDEALARLQQVRGGFGTATIAGSGVVLLPVTQEENGFDFTIVGETGRLDVRLVWLVGYLERHEEATKTQVNCTIGVDRISLMIMVLVSVVFLVFAYYLLFRYPESFGETQLLCVSFFGLGLFTYIGFQIIYLMTAMLNLVTNALKAKYKSVS